MTAIAVALDEKQIALGADSHTFLQSGDDYLTLEREPAKITRIDESTYLACAGDMRTVQWLTDYASRSKALREGKMIAFVTGALQHAQQDPLANLGEDERPSVEIILVTDGRVWAIGHDGAYLEVKRYAAIGAGASLCLGALYALYGRAPVEEAVARAIEAATYHSPFCSGPPNVLLLPRP